MHTSFSSARVALDGEIRIPRPLPCDSLVPLYNDSFLTRLPIAQLLTYACIYRDVIRDTWRVHDPRETDQVHIFMKHLTLIIKLCIIININF